MSLNGIRAGVLLLLWPVMAAVAIAAAPVDAIKPDERARMAAYLADIVPIHDILQIAFEKNPDWLSNKLQPQQAECFRQQSTRESFIERRKPEVDAYATEFPQEFRAGLKLFDEGVAAFFSRMTATMLQALADSDDGKRVDLSLQKELAAFTPEQMQTFMAFATEDRYRQLRDLTGYGDFFDGGASESMGRAKLEQAVADIAQVCGISPEFLE